MIGRLVAVTPGRIVAVSPACVKETAVAFARLVPAIVTLVVVGLHVPLVEKVAVPLEFELRFTVVLAATGEGLPDGSCACTVIVAEHAAAVGAPITARMMERVLYFITQNSELSVMSYEL